MGSLAALAGWFFGFFSMPILALVVGFIIKKSTGKSWGYVLAGALFTMQLLMMAILHLNKSPGA